jgi:RNA polymerase sigma factor (sigma-70 family)
MYETFDAMMARLSPTLKRITHRMNGHFTFFSDDDLYQEAVMHLWIDYQHDVLGDKTDSYILQGCYYYLKNYLRMTLDKAKMVSLYKLIDEDDCTLEDVITIKGRTAMDAAEERIIVDDATLNGLTDREKEVLTLSMEGSTVREIGEKLGISHVMVVKLRGKLKEKYAKLKGELKNEVTK